MKIYVYQGQLDKIPLNAVPFYKEDTMYDYLMVEHMYRGNRFIAKEGHFVSLDELMNLDDDIPIYYPDSQVLDMNCPLTEKPLDIYDVSGDGNMVVLEKFERGKGIIINVVYNENIDFRGFLNICNEHYKKQGYEYVAYHFEIAHKEKPNIGREEYDVVQRMGATEDYMGTRCYIKKFK